VDGRKEDMITPSLKIFLPKYTMQLRVKVQAYNYTILTVA
jgi:hypothetical protein